MSVSDTNKNRGTHGDSSFMLGGLPSSSENTPALAVGSVKSAGNGICKHFDCSNRTDLGYCRTSACIHPNYSQIKNEAYIPVEWNSYLHAYVCTRPNCSYWESTPRDDAVYVVRCKDCENAIDIGKEYLLCPMIDCRVKADFFCAYGERKKDGN